MVQIIARPPLRLGEGEFGLALTDRRQDTLLLRLRTTTRHKLAAQPYGREVGLDDPAAHVLGNPLEPVSTITVSIVNQLTGDTDFTGPQSLVAFALGLTLFIMTLCLNIVALYIVRRFREQYE